MSVINNLLALSLNHILWVILGLAFWVITYLQLYEMSDIFGDVVTLVLSIIPIGIAFVSFNVMAARWSGKPHYEAWVFLALGIVSSVYFLWLYASETRVREVLKKRGVVFSGKERVWNVLKDWSVTFYGLKTRTPRLIFKILVGAISVLASVTFLIIGGWELIQGSVFIGLILSLFGTAMLVFDRWKWRGKWRPWNLLEVTYSALTEGTASSDPAAPQAERAAL